MSRHPTLIETVRVRRGAAPLWGHHLARLFASCRAVGVEPPGSLPTPAGGDDRVHRLLVSSRGVETTERPVGPTDPVRLLTSPVRHEPYPHKTASREPFDRAVAAAQAAGADDGVLLTAGGWVAETAVWGVYWWEDEQLCAPPMELGVLDSVARRRIGELTGGVRERRVRPEELPARAPFVANAARGVLAVRSLDGRAVDLRAETMALAEAFWG